MGDVYPDFVNARFTAYRYIDDPDNPEGEKKQEFANPQARFAINHWFKHNCSADAITSALPA